MKYKFIEVSDLVTDKLWQQLFALREEQRGLINHPKWNFELMKSYLLEDSQGLYSDNENFKRYLVMEDALLIGEFSSYKSNDVTENLGEIVYLRVNITPEFHKEKLLHKIFCKVKGLYPNQATLQLNCNNMLHDKWIRALGGVLKLNLQDHWLDYNDIDVKRLQDYVDSTLSNNPELNNSFYEMQDIPDDLLKEYIDLWNSSLNDEDLGDYYFKFQIPFDLVKNDLVTFDNSQAVIYCQLLFNDKQELIGFSECSIDFDPSNRKQALHLSKGMTGIRSDYRGKGLGKALSSILYIRLKNEFNFSHIESEMSPRNSYILNINRDIGYIENEGITRQEYIIDLNKVENNK
jgi:ribosomal protein S18 acetylase RimI-like enzyme